MNIGLGGKSHKDEDYVLSVVAPISIIISVTSPGNVRNVKRASQLRVTDREGTLERKRGGLGRLPSR